MLSYAAKVQSRARLLHAAHCQLQRLTSWGLEAMCPVPIAWRPISRNPTMSMTRLPNACLHQTRRLFMQPKLQSTYMLGAAENQTGLLRPANGLQVLLWDSRQQSRLQAVDM